MKLQEKLMTTELGPMVGAYKNRDATWEQVQVKLVTTGGYRGFNREIFKEKVLSSVKFTLKEGDKKEVGYFILGSDLNSLCEKEAFSDKGYFSFYVNEVKEV
ncbi:hypothetical protein [Pseudoalteromonas phage J2-1_QLiu-2017]|nr:hypothetical protein [Pseudoalteromonas phage J2-1_QLiu-2017]